MNPIYLDNAATTPMDPEVVKVMQDSMLNNFGNPSSIHQFGRKAKVAIETARKNIARHFNVTAAEVVFTSGGTEANNWVLFNAVQNLNVRRIITSKIEHHAVLHVVEELKVKFDVTVVYVDLDEFGRVDLSHLETLLSDKSLNTLVSLMMVNNEIGNLLPIDKVSSLCKKNNAFFHSDTVQAIGHYRIDLQKTPIDFMIASAHKFHGPKGVGFICFNKKTPLRPFLYGGGQEKGLRSGTENVHAILGMDKALRMAYMDIDSNNKYIVSLKKYFIDNLKKQIEGVVFNGCSSDFNDGSHTIVNVRFPFVDPMLLFNLDLNGVAVSVGSACNSGAQKKSHVLENILSVDECNNSSIRFSFSKMNSIKDFDLFFEKIKKIL